MIKNIWLIQKIVLPLQHQTKNIRIMKEQFDCLVQRMTIEFRRLVTFAFHENNIPMINRLLGVYNTYQEETTKFLCGYESNHLLMHSALKDTIISNATEIVEHMLKHPFCYDQEIYSKILTDHVE